MTAIETSNLSRAGSPSARVLFKVEAAPDESLLSAVRRTACRNYLPNTLALTRAAGNTYGNRAGLAARSDGQIAALGHAIGLAAEDALWRAPRPRGASSISYLGSTYDSALLETRTLRFAPASLEISPHHRAIWDCRLLGYCPVTWQFLLEACFACSVQQGWYHARPIERCHACDADLRLSPADSVDEGLRPSLSILNRLLSPDGAERSKALTFFPPEIEALPAGAVLDLIARFVPAMTDSPVPEIFRLVRRREPGRHAACLARAVEAVQHWSDLERVHREMRERVGDARLVPRRWRRAVAGETSPELEPLLAAARTMLVSGTARGGAPARVKAPVPQLERDDSAINSRLLSRMTGLQPSEIAEYRRQGLLVARKVRKGAGTHLAYDVHIAAELREVLTDGIGWEAFARELGLGKHGIEQLACLGLISPSKHPVVVDHRGPLRFRKGAAAALVERVRSSAAPEHSLVAPRPLSLAASVARPGLKPWGPIFAAMLDGHMGYAVRGGTGPLVDLILVGWDALPAIRSMSFDRSTYAGFAFDDYMSMRETLAELNLQPKALPALREQGISEARGANRRSVLVEAVARLATEFVSGRELMIRTGQDACDTAAFLRRAGIENSMIGWPRDAAERTLGERLLLP